MKRSAKALLKMGEQGIPGLLQKVQVSPQQIWELFFHFQLKLKKKKGALSFHPHKYYRGKLIIHGAVQVVYVNWF